jgi:hypothetical protein
MAKLSYTIPTSESVGEKGQVIKTSNSISYELADLPNATNLAEIAAYEIEKLTAMGYEVDVVLKPKVPKEPKE